MIPTSRQVVRKAYSDVGYKCRKHKASFSKYLDTKHPKLLYGKKYGVADWCAIHDLFVVVACAKNTKDGAYTACVPLKSYAAGVKWLYKYMKAKGRVTSIAHYGDYIFLRNSKGKLSHVGIVYKVTKDKNYYIAGNEAVYVKGKKYEKVRKHKISKKSKKIYAYGRPLYSDWKSI